MQTKQCSRCGQIKTVKSFQPDLRYRLGVHGWCRTCRRENHREREEVIKGLPKPDGDKQCTVCKVVKPVRYFSLMLGKKSGRSSRCKKCRNEIESTRRTPQGGKRNHLWSFFRMTLDDFHELIQSQGGKCAICGKVPSRPALDHCHLTGALRGMLCLGCNSLLRAIEDKIFMRAAIRYLEIHERSTPKFYKRKNRAIIDNEPCATNVSE